MKNNTDTLTFVGNHPETDKPMCGVITSDFDVEHLPFYFEVNDGDVIITTAGKQARYAVPDDLIAAIRMGAEFYVANVGGSDTAHLATARKPGN